MDKDQNISFPADDSSAAAPEGARKGRRGATGRDGGPNRGPGRDDKRGDKEQSEWEEKIIQVRRVTKVVKGGKKLSFRAVVAVGNHKGQVGIGVGKASEVVSAIQKGVVDAKKSLISVPLVGATIPHQITGKTGSSRILLKPAAKGTGVIAGGAARAILELAGVGDVLSKSLGARSPLNVARATVDGLSNLRTFEEAARLRGVSIRQLFA
ncbi:MAG: 30S ribosomal protein S5 [Cyanobacteria bacterium REEB67]|jgi:small subunit ribosomal protein S5|nr:30S ribosomal protein S5 [Cyanobacteria bacterium REEB67]